MTTNAERQRRYRLRHPEQTTAHLADLRAARPRRKKGQPRNEERHDGQRNVTQQTETGQRNADDIGQDRPESAALDPRAVVESFVAELADISRDLKAKNLSPDDRATLRLRADIVSRQIIAAEKLRAMPKRPSETLSQYMRRKDEEKAALPPTPEATYHPHIPPLGRGEPEPRGLVAVPVAPEPPPEPKGPEADPLDATTSETLPATLDLSPSLDHPPTHEPLPPVAADVLDW